MNAWVVVWCVGIMLSLGLKADEVFSENFDTNTLGSTPISWVTSDNWKVRQFGTVILACQEDATAGGGRKLSRLFTQPITDSWVVDFDYAWAWGGNKTNNYGNYALTVDMDMLDAAGNGYRVRVHQGKYNWGVYTDKTIEIFKITTGNAATLLSQGLGYNTPGWKTRGLTSPSPMNHVQLSWDQATRRLTAYRDTGAGLEVSSSVVDLSFSSFTRIVFTTGSYSYSEQPQLDNVRVNVPKKFVWGVDGHPCAHEYEDVGTAAQIGLVAELGCSYYRVDVRDSLDPYNFTNPEAKLDELLTLASSSGIKILPILYRPINLFDTSYTLADVYQLSYNRGLAFAQKYKGKFDSIEIENELDWKCILSGVDGKLVSDYDDSLPVQKLSRCKAVIRGLLDGVRDGDPTVKRAVGTCGWYHYGFIDSLLADGANFETLVLHWYSNSGSVTRAMKGWSSYGKPIWLTEMNRQKGSYLNAEADQADMVAKFANEVWNLPNIEAIFVYELLDEPRLGSTAPEAYYGLCSLVRNSANTLWLFNARKAAFSSYQIMVQTLGTLPSSGDIIVDDAYLSPAMQWSDSTTWLSDDTDPGFYFDGYRQDNNSNKTGATARFYPYIPATGNYVVSIRYPASTSSAAMVPVKIVGATGTSSATINQQQSGGVWTVLGTYSFNAGESGQAGYVEISNLGTTGKVVVDAVRFHKQ